MKKKLLSFILAICLLIPCSLALTACGSNPPDNPHTHNWSTTWSRNSSEHWLTCDGCDEKKDKGNHDGEVCSICGYESNHIHDWPESYQRNSTHHWKKCNGCDSETTKVEHDYNSNNTCKQCGYVNNSLVPLVTNVRDLEVITYDTGSSGLYTLVKLPDGKNMVIDSGNEDFDTNLMIEDNLLYTQGLWCIDYFVLTNTNAVRTGQAAYIIRTFEVLNLYTPRVIGSTPSCYTDAVAMASNSCNVVEVAESNCDISCQFRDSSNNTYSYTIDFMLPAATTDCINDYDASTAISIEYQGKTILITGDNSQINIKGYIDNYDGQKDVDVLICSFVGVEPYAITNSISFAGKDYFECISLEDGDYAIISPISLPDRSNVLATILAGICGGDNVYLLTEQNDLYTAYVTINGSGQITVTAN